MTDDGVRRIRSMLRRYRLRRLEREYVARWDRVVATLLALGLEED